MVPRKMASTHWVLRLRRKYDAARGEYIDEPNCSMSSTTEKTNPVKVTIPPPTAARNDCADDGAIWFVSTDPSSSSYSASSWDSPQAPRIPASGIGHRACSH